jgi:hypothetical protein
MRVRIRRFGGCSSFLVTSESCNPERVAVSMGQCVGECWTMRDSRRTRGATRRSRCSGPIETIGLSGKDLSGKDLSGKDLSGKDLSGKDLSGIDLPGIDLPGIDLPGHHAERSALASQTTLTNIGWFALAKPFPLVPAATRTTPLAHEVGGEVEPAPLALADPARTGRAFGVRRRRCHPRDRSVSITLLALEESTSTGFAPQIRPVRRGPLLRARRLTALIAALPLATAVTPAPHEHRAGR